MKKNKYLIDRLLDEAWFLTEEEAQKWVMLRRVLVNDRQVLSLKEKVPIDGVIRIKEYYKVKYVNKGGLKLEGALRDFSVNISGKVVLDCGASTGGFTDCLINSGAKLVYAVDAGFGQLAGKLLINKNVVNLEKTNLSDEVLLSLHPVPEIITLDLSYLSLKKAVPICREIIKNQGIIICLVKPIYEVDSAEIRRTGEINDIKVIRDVLFDLAEYFINQGYSISGITNSPVTGNNGTLEYFFCLFTGGSNENINLQIETYIEKALDKSFKITPFDKNHT